MMLMWMIQVILIKTYIEGTNANEKYILNFIKTFDKNNYKHIYSGARWHIGVIHLYQNIIII